MSAANKYYFHNFEDGDSIHHQFSTPNLQQEQNKKQSAQISFNSRTQPAMPQLRLQQQNINEQILKQKQSLNQAQALQQNSAYRYDGSVIFWNVLSLIILVPLVISLFTNVTSLAGNIHKNIKLKNNHKVLLSQKENLEGKISDVSSPQGLKRTIKEQIRSLEPGEVLIKLQ